MQKTEHCLKVWKPSQHPLTQTDLCATTASDLCCSHRSPKFVLYKWVEVRFCNMQCLGMALVLMLKQLSFSDSRRPLLDYQLIQILTALTFLGKYIFLKKQLVLRTWHFSLCISKRTKLFVEVQVMPRPRKNSLSQEEEGKKWLFTVDMWWTQKHVKEETS